MSQQTTSAPLTVVLVHGAFADSSSWAGVIERLQAKGVPVVAAANPLRGISIDSAYVASVFDQIPGPVLAVGHSYGGAVISNAGSLAKNVVGLVFVAAFAPDEGEVLNDVSVLQGQCARYSVGTRQYPTESGTGTEFFIDPAKAHEVFAGDLTAAQAALIGTIQRPVTDIGLASLGVPAWKTLPSWAVVATKDRAAGTDVVPLTPNAPARRSPRSTAHT